MMVLTHEKLKGKTKRDLEISLRQERVAVTQKVMKKKENRRKLEAEMDALKAQLAEVNADIAEDETRLRMISDSEAYL